MRLIDADALKSYIDCGHLRSPTEKCFSELDVVQMLDKRPTIAAVPLDRLGDFGKLFVDYEGCPRGAMGRACMPIEEEVLQMKPITDVDGGRWIPVNVDALMHLATEYVRLRDTPRYPVVHAHWIHCKGKTNLWYCSNCGAQIRYNQKRRTYNINKLPVHEINKCCRACGAHMDGDPHDSGQ